MSNTLQDRKIVVVARPRAAIAAVRQLHRFSGRTLIAWSASGNVIFLRRHARRLQKRLTGARVELIPHTRAFISDDQPEVLAKAIHRLLAPTPELEHILDTAS
ncbi:alpha/beta hydrolase family protein [Mycobacterium kiyosense]|nr:hypothetical protein IWGMT90018_41010 [Mycobacterium kiyosense]